MRYQHWAAIVIIASAVSGCVVEGGEVSNLSAHTFPLWRLAVPPPPA